MLRRIEEARTQLERLNYSLVNTTDVLRVLATYLSSEDIDSEAYGAVDVVIERLDELSNSLDDVQFLLREDGESLESILRELEAPELKEPMKLLNDDGKQRVIEFIQDIAVLEKYAV